MAFPETSVLETLLALSPLLGWEGTFPTTHQPRDMNDTLKDFLGALAIGLFFTLLGAALIIIVGSSL